VTTTGMLEILHVGVAARAAQLADAMVAVALYDVVWTGFTLVCAPYAAAALLLALDVDPAARGLRISGVAVAALLAAGALCVLERGPFVVGAPLSFAAFAAWFLWIGARAVHVSRRGTAAGIE
jgi:hypothetical protein